jgi:mycofactocin system glycosyltransferase
MTTRFVVDASWRRIRSSAIVIAGSPLKVFRVTPTGESVIDALETGSDLPSHHAPLTDRLLAAGAIHPVIDEPIPANEITVVIPAYITNNASMTHLHGLVEMLKPISVVIVDDASPLVITSDDAHVVRHSDNKGPGAARNTGAARVTTPYLAFIDTDCLATADDLCSAAGHFLNPRVGLVAPRVASIDDGSTIGQYESAFSPLDMGNRPARVSPMSRVSYVPSAVMLVRTEAFQQLGGFLTSLRYGEDVDFVWRMTDSTWHCRYDPHVVCKHRNRTSWQDVAQQRMSYGEAAAQLFMLHPNRLAPLYGDAATVTSVATCALGFPLTALSSGVISSSSLWRELRNVRLPAVEVTRIIINRFTHTAYMTALAITRVWLPVLIVCAFVSQRIRRLLLIAIVAPALWETRLHSSHHVEASRIPQTIIMRAFDHGSYAAGVWKGMIRARTFGPLLPRITAKRSSSD